MITERDAGIIFDVMFEGIREALVNGEEVKIREFGTFYIHNKKARRAYHPQTQEPIDVPPRNSIKFKVSKNLTEKVN